MLAFCLGIAEACLASRRRVVRSLGRAVKISSLTFVGLIPLLGAVIHVVVDPAGIGTFTSYMTYPGLLFWLAAAGTFAAVLVRRDLNGKLKPLD